MKIDIKTIVIIVLSLVLIAVSLMLGYKDQELQTIKQECEVEHDSTHN